MANSIDIGAIALGACLGYGLRNEIKSSAGVCKSALLAGIGVAAAAAAAGAEAAKETQAEKPQAEKPQSQNGGNV